MSEEVIIKLEKYGDYSIRFDPGEFIVEFQVFKHIAWDAEGYHLYHLRGASTSDKHTQKYEEADRFIMGSIKWDGCSDLHFFPDEKGHEHFCGEAAATSCGIVLAAVFRYAKKYFGDRWDD